MKLCRAADDVFEKIVWTLFHPTMPRSLMVVVPAGFDVSAIAMWIEREMIARQPEVPVARIAVDGVRSSNDFVRVAERGWREKLMSGGLSPNTEAHEALQSLLSAPGAATPALLILERFHRVLDVVDNALLAALRSLETTKRLRTLVLSSYPYEELKLRWNRRGQKLTVSNYGDAHGEITLLPLTSEETLEEGRKLGIEDFVARYAFAVTGGMPDALDEVFRTRDLDRGRFDDEARRRLASSAARKLRAFVQRLDRDGEVLFLGHVTSVYQRVDAEESLHFLRRHPWHDSLVLGDGQVAEGVGTAAIEIICEAHARQQPSRGDFAATIELARVMYERRQFHAAHRLLQPLPEILAPGVAMLRRHSEIMNLLLATESGEAGVDTDWRKLGRAVKAAAEDLSRRQLDPEFVATLSARYNELSAMATTVQGLVDGSTVRLVDRLMETADASETHALTVLRLLALKIESNRSMPGSASACHAALALPEQLFRIWARWTLELRDDAVPTACEDVWAEAERLWGRGELSRSAEGSRFSSHEAFAFFALAYARLKFPELQERAPERTAEELRRALSHLDLRRDTAHSITVPSERTRRMFFELIDRWYLALLPACRGHVRSFTRAEVVALLEPLPLWPDR